MTSMQACCRVIRAGLDIAGCTRHRLEPQAHGVIDYLAGCLAAAGRCPLLIAPCSSQRRQQQENGHILPNTSPDSEVLVFLAERLLALQGMLFNCSEVVSYGPGLD